VVPTAYFVERDRLAFRLCWLASYGACQSHGKFLTLLSKSNSTNSTQLWVRNIQDPRGLERSVYQHHFGTARETFNNADPATTAYRELGFQNIDTNRWHDKREWEVNDYRVIDLLDGVAVHPTGKDRGLLTAVIERVERTEDSTLMFSEIGDYIEEHRDELEQGLEVMNSSRDAEAQKDWRGQYDRHAAAIGFPPPKKTAS
jgi:hypothetical protein